MQWKDVGAMIGQAAPIVGGLLGGPAGAAAGILVAKGLGVNATPDDVARVIQGDPEALLKIKELESSERVRFQELAVQAAIAELNANAADRDSARKREMAVHDYVPAMLAGASTVLLLIALAVVAIIKVPDGNKDWILYVVTTVGNGWMMAMGYFLGGSLSSDRKTTLLAKTTGSAP